MLGSSPQPWLRAGGHRLAFFSFPFSNAVTVVAFSSCRASTSQEPEGGALAGLGRSPVLPGSGAPSQPGTRSQPRHSDRVQISLWSRVSEQRNGRPEGPLEIRCHRESGPLAREHTATEGQGQASCVWLLVLCSLQCPPHGAASCQMTSPEGASPASGLPSSLGESLPQWSLVSCRTVGVPATSSLEAPLLLRVPRAIVGPGLVPGTLWEPREQAPC